VALQDALDLGWCVCFRSALLFQAIEMASTTCTVPDGVKAVRDLRWTEEADSLTKRLDSALGSKKFSYGFAHRMEGATDIECSPTCANGVASL
jgi:hypothetical protein